MSAAHELKHEIIIVKRGGDHEDGHHGGVWKIAFADFMTAMMCFFLVMWLINASNEQTKASVASYFNPIKLIDRNSSRKGLEDIGDGPNAVGMDAEIPEKAETKAGAEGQARGGSSENEISSELSETPQHSDTSLFADPYAVLAEIAAETGTLQNISPKGDGGAQTSGPANGASGGESYRDPFAPDFWSQQVAEPDNAAASAERSRTDGGNPATAVSEATFPEPTLASESASDKPAPAAPTARPDAKQTVETAVEPSAPREQSAPLAAASPEEPAKPREEDKEPEPRAAEDKPTKAAQRAAEAVRAELVQAFEPGDQVGDNLEVVATAKGVEISVTDQLDFGMFEIGSAVPRRELVLAMEKIAKVLSARQGQITINGHTDARPFKSGAYDNWRLSSARAQSAYYMLSRAGLDERRVLEIAGYADRSPKDARDPLAAVNRRIEILLEVAP